MNNYAFVLCKLFSYIASSSVKPRSKKRCLFLFRIFVKPAHIYLILYRGVNVDEVERKRKFQESNERRWRWQQTSNNTSLRSNFSITVEKPIVSLQKLE